MKSHPLARRIAVAVVCTAAAWPAGAEETQPQAPVMDDGVRLAPFDPTLFGGDPVYPETPYDPAAQIAIYGAKRPVDTARPPIEIGRDLYTGGPLGDGFVLIGEKNRLFPQFLAYGDFRTAVAFNDNGGKSVGQVAARLNLDLDLKLTATERIHVFLRPIDEGGQFSRYEFAGPNRNRNADPEIELRAEPETAFFEGDMGAIVSGLTDEYTTWDLPFAFGRMPLLLQNGVWMEDAFLGAAFTIPALNSRELDITNFDITFFAGWGEITSDAFLNANGKRADNDADMYGVTGFFDLKEGYLEVGYAYLHDTQTENGDHSYHNLTAAFTRRYGGWLANSTRIIINAGQDPGGGRPKTADGVILLSENSLITSLPLTLVPYGNFWIGKDTPQSAARAGGAGGVLRNTGINFEDDGLTGFPTLDPTGRDTVGGAIGVSYLFSLEQQLVVEAAAVFPWDNQQGPAKDNQYALGIRYQRPLSKNFIIRADAMYGIREGLEDVSGIRLELRAKF